MIKKPKFDLRKFKGGKLNNDIKYILINDTTLDKSYVTVSINSGCINDPIEYQGLSHFLEHLLFMGSKKYPDSSYFMNIINKHGGYTNAFTELEYTVYFFNIFNEGLNDIIDIFSRFFIDPLFNENYINKEINAINSEHQKNINNDNWNINQLMYYLTNNNSQLNKFYTGSYNTLNKKNIREKLIEFYKYFYNNKNISICIASSKSFDELKDIITNTFGNINNESNYILTINKPFLTENINKTFHIKTFSNIYDIYYIWEIPLLYTNYKYKQFDILAEIIKNKSENSLIFYLKNMGYINNINIEINDEGLFIIKLSICENEIHNINKIETILFSTLYKIYNLDLHKYSLYYQQIYNNNFNYNDKINIENLCILLANNHHKYNTSEVFINNFIIYEILSTSDYKQIYEKYINHNNYLKIIASKSLEKFNINIDNLKYLKLFEYNTEYCYIDFNKTIIDDKINIINIDIDNNYLLNNYQNSKNNKIINYTKSDNNIPILVGTKKWFGKYSKFNEPIVYILLHFNNIKYFESPMNYILTNLSNYILNYLITIILNKPLLLYNYISISNCEFTNSINISIKSINNFDKLFLFINEINNFIANIKIYFNILSKKYIDNLIILFKKKLNNIIYYNSWNYTNFIIKNNFSISVLINELDNINYNIIKNYINTLFDNSSLTSIIYGNVDFCNIKNIFKKFNIYFKQLNYNLSKKNILKTILGNTHYKIIIHPNINEKSNCYTNYYYIGKFKPKKYILLKLFINMVSQDFFNFIRTENQLGYLCSMDIEIYNNKYYIIQKVQSEKNIDIIENYINQFNNNIIELIKSLKINDFINILKNELLEFDNSMYELYSKYINEILNRTFLFNRKEILFKKINNINYSKLIKFINKYFYTSTTQIKTYNNKYTLIIKGN